ncbi:translocation/assembly module TamB domain-containing protein [Sphingomonas sp.]|jgi:translocation and assembly module TamB|uniref:translocation/assembly module TamB domain-containing protein n=1 Tax=Sphingomonas sp. TaxID=28214 RepID=UPI002D7E6E89|nr:translocation/assembly module TamB domain-containing protein [Sphingomonas sp.]HEU0043683.1 translocation/assembly module TamB domain-containing protein [Sphingomonas sp.]
MADNEAVATEPRQRPLWLRVLKWLGIALLSIAALLLLVVFGINTDPGRRFVADQLGGYTTATGLNIKVGRIDGSLYGKMTLSDVRVADPRGVFLTSPRMAVDWRPFAFVRDHIDVRSLDTELVMLRRRPELKQVPVDPNAPLLPDLDIDVNRLHIGRLVIAAPVTGRQHVLRIDGTAKIADRRAQITADAAALRAAGVAGGDTLRLKLDAVPDQDKLDVDVKLTAPVGGVVATMGGLTKPLTATVDGRGGWKTWAGRAIVTLGGGQLANLGVTSRNGTIAVRGVSRPGLYLEGPVERLTAPQLNVRIDATLAERRADTRIKLGSSALAVDAGGLLDFAQSRFGNFAVDARLLTPGAIAPNLSGRDVMARVVLDGAFATPTVNYKVSAARLAFGAMGVDQLYAEGLARVNPDRILVPISARARRLTGLNAAVGGLANNVRIDGDLAISMPNILSDNLKIRSDNIDATAILVANVATGRYTGALKGRINDFRVESIGIIDLTTDAKLVAGRNGGFGITGRVVARTQQLFNSGVRNFLGGNAVVRADVGYSPEGIVTFSGLRLNAPQFRVMRGSGRFNPANGAVAVEADAYSTQYGPVTARVAGTATAPVIDLRAARPGFGVGLANVRARIIGRGGAYQVDASGSTDYGPFTADVLVQPGAQLALDIRRVVFAGITGRGRLVQTAAGPFAGALTFGGQGLSGNVRLASQGGYQRADVRARGNNAVVPGIADFTIGRALLDASVVLYPNAPQIIADAQLGDARYNAIVIEAARAKVNYVGGRGTAQALLTGSSGVPFRVALNARLSPGSYLVAAQGQANRIPFRTATPARIVAAGGGYRLLPTRLDFGGANGGSTRIAGLFGGGVTAAQARLDRLDLSFLSAFAPGMGLSGQATGSLDYRQQGSAIPVADARVTVTNFQRSGIAAISDPVDIVFAGRLGGSGADARALIKRGPTVVGRMLATMRPLGGGGSWMTRLMNAPLGGGIRYNGPSAVLFSLAALPNQSLQGPIAMAADFSGRLSAPRLNGLIRADNLTYDNETYGTRLSQMRLAGRFNNDRLEITQLNARAGDGTVVAQGSIGLASDAGYPIDFRATLNNAQLARSEALAATTTGTIHLTNGRNGGLIEGDLVIPNARYQIIRQGQAEVPELTGVRRRSDVRPARFSDRPPTAPMGLFRLNLRVRAPNQIFVSGMGLESEWEMDLRIGGTSAAPVITGGLDIVKGAYSFAGKRFEVTRGRVRLRGAALTDPDIDIQATTTTNGITAVINITGTGTRPQIAFTSTPALPQDEVLSRLLFGTTPTNLSAIEAVQLAAALNSLRGSGGGGLNPLGKLRSATGFDRLRVVGAGETGRGTGLAAGKYITDDIYVEIVTDARGFTATQLEIALTKALSLLTSTGSFGGSDVRLKYSKDY